MRCDKLRVGMFLALIGVLAFAAVGTFLYFDLPSIIRRKINEQTYLGFNRYGEYTNTTKKWMTPDYTFFLQVWTFSVQNADDVVQLGAKPHLVEKGPYTYTEFQQKSVAFIGNNTRVLYRNKRTYYFNRLKSCPTCELDDPITVPNIVLQKMLDAVKDNLFYRTIFDTILHGTGTKLFVKTTVGDLLFNGYKDPLISKWCEHPVISGICRALNIPDRIGLFYKKNGTDELKYEIDSGLTSVDLIGKVYSYDNHKIMNAWYDDRARMINGTDGQLYPPGLDRRDSSKLQLFIGQICRTIEMEFNGKSIYQDVPVFLYHPSRVMNDVERERSMGFCNPNTPVYFENTYVQSRGCTPAGLMDMSSCLPGNPRIYLSQPHFLGSSPALADALIGVGEPSQYDDTVIGIEPSSGVVVFAQQHTQLNMGLINGSLDSLAKFQNRIIPIIWLNDSASLDADTREQLVQLNGYKSVAFWGGIGSYSLVLLCILIVLALFIVRAQRTPSIEHERLVDITGDSQLNSTDDTLQPLPNNEVQI